MTTALAKLNNNDVIGWCPNNPPSGSSDLFCGRVSASVWGVSAALSGGLVTTPALQVDQSAASAVTGLLITSAASGSGLTLSLLGGTNESLVISTKGTGIVSVLNGTNAQELRVYNTRTDASNGEWGALQWGSNEFRLGAFKNGSGTLRSTVIPATTSAAPFVIRQSGGTAGQNEIQFYNDGTSSFVTTPNNSGHLKISSTGSFNGVAAEFLVGTTVFASFGNSSGATGIDFPSTAQIRFTNNSTPAAGGGDLGIKRAAGGVLAVTDSASGTGWLQNSAGRARLTANATNATATPSNLTDLSLTLIAGRKYTGRLVLFANNSTAAEGLQFDFNGGNATFTSIKFGFTALPPGSGLVLGTLTSTAAGTALTATTATTADAVYVIEITIVCNAAGTIIPRFAEVSHTSGTATVELGSNFWLEDSPN